LGLPHSLCHPIRKYGIYSPNKEYIFETPKAEACALDVRKLYQYLAHQAAALGTEILLRTKAKHACFESEKNTVKITTDSPSGHFDFLSALAIDASGFSSIIGRSLGLVNDWERFGVGAEYEAYAEKVDVEMWALMVGQRYSPAGYAWIFPVAENKVRIGVGIGRPESATNPFEQLSYLLEKRPGPLKKLGRICPLDFHYGVVPSQGPRNLTVMDGALLVGDSAGQVNPLLLEGIRFAMEFGKIAGEVAKRAIDQADTSKATLEEYEKRWKKEVWNSFQVGLRVQRKWLQLSDEQWDNEATILDSLSAREVLELLRAQFSTRKLMGLVSRHPRLLKSQSFSTILRARV